MISYLMKFLHLHFFFQPHFVYLTINYHWKMLLNMKYHYHYEYVVNLCLFFPISLFSFPLLNPGLFLFYTETHRFQINYFNIIIKIVVCLNLPQEIF